MGLAQRFDHLHLVIWRDQNGMGLLGDNGVENRNLQGNVPFGSTLIDEFGTNCLGCGFGALVHGDVESVSGEAGNKCDSNLVLRRGLAGDQRGGRSGSCHAHHFNK